MQIIFFIMLISPSLLLSYPLFLSSGHTNHPKVLEITNITGINPTDMLSTDAHKTFAINNATLIVSNQEKPNQRITIKINKLLPPPPGSKITEPPAGKVKILLDSVSFIGVEGSYQIEETGQNQFDAAQPPTPPAPTSAAASGTALPVPSSVTGVAKSEITMVDKGTAQASAMRKNKLVTP